MVVGDKSKCASNMICSPQTHACKYLVPEVGDVQKEYGACGRQRHARGRTLLGVSFEVL